MASDDKISITGRQVRAARALLRYSAAELAGACRIGEATVARAEKSDGPITTLTAGNLHALRSTMEALGIIFIDADSTAGSGVRLVSDELDANGDVILPKA